MWRPSDRLDSGGVLGKLPEWSVAKLVPDNQLVVVASGCELSIFLVPLQSADLLLMSDELAKPLLWLADVAVVDKAVARASCEDVVVPCQSTNSLGVTSHGS